MPTYRYKCQSCSNENDYMAPITHDESPPCEACGKATKRVPVKNFGGFQLKGKGWFKGGGFS